MKEKSDHNQILLGKEQLGPFPMERLRRVAQPTTRITGSIQRIDGRTTGFAKLHLGHFGEEMRTEWNHMHPITASEKLVSWKFMSKDMVDGEIAPSKAPISQEPVILSRHIKSLGYFYRADIVGICELPQWAVYSHDEDGNPVELNHQFAIMLCVDQSYRTMHGSTGHDWISRSQSSRGYAHTGLIACMMADYIRRLGFPARAHVFRNELVVMPPLLLLAGIGEVSRPGIILNPFLGLRFKTSVVTTDLQLLPDKPIDFGLQEFCRQCNKCAVHCPSRAISHEDKVMHNGYETWKLDYTRCLKYRVLNPIGDCCGRCIKVCPWNKPQGWPHNVVRWMVQHTPSLNRFLIKMNDIVGYGKPDEKSKWWFDLEEVDGILQIPQRINR